MRQQLTFAIAGATCAATLDSGPSPTGLLIVSGGNEIRSGAHRGMARLAADVAARGYPVFRYDRRGIGDSEGENGSFRSSAADIAAAARHFRAEAGVKSIQAFGNCDAATALALFGEAAGIDRLLLANPWTFDEDDEPDDDGAAAPAVPALPPASVIRARYLARLKDPRQLWRLATGGVDYRKLLSGLRAARGGAGGSGGAPLQGLAAELVAALDRLTIPAHILLAAQDRTAMAFADAWAKAPRSLIARIPVERIDSGSHGFADDDARAWLTAQIVGALAKDPA